MKAPFFAALGVYAVSVATGVQWGDSAKLTQQLFDQDPSFALGLGAHPLHTLLALALSALLSSVLSVAAIANLLSALLGALSVAFAAATTFELTRDRARMWLTAALLCFAHTHWYLSSLCESYTLGAALLAGACFAVACAARQPRLAFFAGLALAVSPLGNAFPAFAWLGLAVWLVATARNGLSWYLAGSVVGAILCIAGFLSAQSVDDLRANVHGQATTYADARQLLRQLAETPLILGFQFASPVVAWSLWRSRLRCRPALCGLAIAAFTLAFFAATYLRTKQFNLLVGVVVLIAIGLGVVAPRLSWRAAAAHAAWMIFFYAASPLLIGNAAAQVLAARPVPGRDAAYFLQPWKRTRTEPTLWARAVLAEVPVGGTLVADYTLMRVVQFVNASEAHRSDVRFVETDRFMRPGGAAALTAQLERQPPVVLAQDYAPYYFTAALSSRFVIEPCGVLFCLR